MNLSKSVFTSKYLNKKHFVSSLFLVIVTICALIIFSLLLILLMQPQLSGNKSLLLSALIFGLIMLAVCVYIIWQPKSQMEAAAPKADLAQDKDRIEEINDLNNEKKYFASVLSHDLRSPLSSIILLASYLKSKEGLTDSNHYIELIEQSARKELEMMGTLLSLMRADVFNDGNVEEVHLNDLVSAVASSLEHSLSIKHLRFNSEVPQELSLTADRQTLTFILNNLLIQAIRFSELEKPIEIHAKEEGNQIKITLRIESGELSKQVGEDLFMSDKLASQQGGKAFPESMELYFCRKAAKGHNGTIHVITMENSPVCAFELTLDRQLSKNKIVKTI